MQNEDYFLNQVAEILIIDTSHVADPFVSGWLPLFAEGKSQSAVDIWEY